MQARGRSWLEAAGLVLVRQRPAKGFMFLTMEDETGAANVVVWVKIFEKFRRVLLASAMLGVRGRIQREEEVVHLVAHELTDLSAGLASVGNRKTPFPLPHGRGTRPSRRIGHRSARHAEGARHRRCSMTISTISRSRRGTSGSASGRPLQQHVVHTIVGHG
ncbi:MAG: hypothetical protein EOS07_34770 [Mesorhizobium sp.]|nr:MAG: hypothetical protein EOS07_34770 [Mesorhizobium sp.]